MIGHFPVVLLVPGLLFLAAGFFYYSRAAAFDPEQELSSRLIAANRRTGNLSIMFGVIELVIAIPLGIAIQQVVQ